MCHSSAFWAIKTANVNAAELRHVQPVELFMIGFDAPKIGLSQCYDKTTVMRKSIPCVLQETDYRIKRLCCDLGSESFFAYIGGLPTLVGAEHSPLLWLQID